MKFSAIRGRQFHKLLIQFVVPSVVKVHDIAVEELNGRKWMKSLIRSDPKGSPIQTVRELQFLGLNR